VSPPTITSTPAPTVTPPSSPATPTLTLAFTAHYPGGVSAIYLRSLGTGGSETRLVSNASRPALSPDGKWVAYEVQVGNAMQIFRTDARGTSASPEKSCVVVIARSAVCDEAISE
jgi:Tol biopolymer transport system component